MGTVSVTKNGIKCQRWDTNHPHKIKDALRPKTRSGAMDTGNVFNEILKYNLYDAFSINMIVFF